MDKIRRGAQPDTITPVKITKSIPLLDTPLQLKSEARLLHYDYEVEQINKEYQPKDPIITFLLVYRDNQDKPNSLN